MSDDNKVIDFEPRAVQVGSGVPFALGVTVPSADRCEIGGLKEPQSRRPRHTKQFLSAREVRLRRRCTRRPRGVRYGNSVPKSPRRVALLRWPGTSARSPALVYSAVR